MSALEDQLRTLRVYNDHGFFNGAEPAGQVWLGYNPREPRGVRGAYWGVYRKNVKTDPEGPWYFYGNKAFSAWDRGPNGESPRALALKRAQEYCAEQYGITEWKRTPFGGYGDAGFVKARLAQLKAQLS